MFERLDAQAHPDKANLTHYPESCPVTSTPQSALHLATDNHTSLRAALAALKDGERPGDLTTDVLLERRRQVHAEDRLAETELSWKHGAPPPLTDLIEQLQSDLVTNEEAMELFQLYPGQKVL